MSKLEQLGPYQLEQRPGVFPLGSDALALGRFATVRKGWRVCDLGTGSGVLLLLLATREPQLELFGLDQDPATAVLAQDNLGRNGLEGQIWTGSWSQAPFSPGSFDLVVSNPPYYAPGSGKDGGPARMEREELDTLCRAASRLLRNGGRFALSFPTQRMVDLFEVMRRWDLEPKRLKLLSHTPTKPPYALLVEGVRQGKPGLQVLPCLE
ncbi:methyltransferase [Pseudoflavonifractor phocaeensis]|uniref:tRNA1(Val) (adenine(37)-N6)-methyltransferase n=1 Tax=Pseudoflavonifractor phocaeensis TaxID=1870988 RepID=UPI0025A34DF3|nr:methyltransferase [Pseudoflavonifractor phocaeensis]MDM8239809.1 methyltransferase [Pseudoflavonifractor phocaeensis]